MRISAGIEKICAERVRQMTAKGYTLDHDLAKSEAGDLVSLAQNYLYTEACLRTDAPDPEAHIDDRLSALSKAGALIAAEIDLVLNLKHGVEANSTIGGIWRA